MHRRHKRKLAVGLAVAIVAACAGGAYAATQSAGPGTRQAFLNDVAKRLHVTPQQLRQALSGATIDQLQAEVKAGRLTQAQANALEQRLKNAGGAPLVAPVVPFGLHPFRAIGPRGPVGAGGPLRAAAGYLGLTAPQLLQQLASGKSLAQIAGAKGKSVSGLEQAMTAAVKSKLDKAVAAKAITQAQEQQFLKDFSSQLSKSVNAKGVAGLRGELPRLGGPFRGKGFLVPPSGGPLKAPPKGGRFAVPPPNAPLPQGAPGAVRPSLPEAPPPAVRASF